MMRLSKKGSILILFLIGIIVPFTPLVIFEVFVLPIPLGIVFMILVIDTIMMLYSKSKKDFSENIYILCLIPIFVLSQFLSTYSVDKLQRLRSQGIIEQLDEINKTTGNYPDKYDKSFGLKYEKLTNNQFQVSYSRGFLVTEKYDSVEKKWKSLGWND